MQGTLQLHTALPPGETDFIAKWEERAKGTSTPLETKASKMSSLSARLQASPGPGQAVRIAEISLQAASPCSHEHLAAVWHLLPGAEQQQEAPTAAGHH